MSARVAQALLQSLPTVTALVASANITTGAVAKNYAGADAIVVNANGGTASAATAKGDANFMIHVYSADEARAEAICSAVRGALRGAFRLGGVTAAGVRVHGLGNLTMPVAAPERYEQHVFTRIFNFSLKIWEG